MRIAAYQQQVLLEGVEGDTSPRAIQTELRDRTLSAVKMAAELGVRALCLQELSDLPYFPASNELHYRLLAENVADHELVTAVRKIARESRMLVVLPIYERFQDETYSTAVVIEENGEVLGSVRKYPVGRGVGYFEKEFFGGQEEPGYAVFSSLQGRIGVTLSRGGLYFKNAETMVTELGAKLIFNPRSQLAGLSQGVLEGELARHAREWGYSLVMANRVGDEAWPIGSFSGGSLILNHDGIILKQASPITDELIMAEMDWASAEPRAAAGLRVAIPESLHSNVRKLLKKTPASQWLH